MSDRVPAATAKQLDFSRVLEAGDTVVWGQGGAEPPRLISQLMSQLIDCPPVRLLAGLSTEGDVAPRRRPVGDYLSYCGTGQNAALVASGSMDILPWHYSELYRSIQDGDFRVDVVLLFLPPADRYGVHSIGVANEYLSAALSRARLVVAEVSPHVPHTNSSVRVHASELDLVTYSTSRPLEVPPRQLEPTDRQIGQGVAELIPDGATIQAGIGSLPTAVIEALSSHRRLGLHTGAISDAMAGLIQIGAIDNAAKSRDRGTSVGGILLGSRQLYEFADDNPAIQLRDIGYTHDLRVLASMPAFVAINGALQIDLTGQVNAEVVAGRYLGAVGGAADFARGAMASKGGFSVHVLRSRVGDHSCVVPVLEGPTTLARSDIGFVVTEHGVADLRLASVHERVRRMIAIAHPGDRESLQQDAARLYGTPT